MSRSTRWQTLAATLARRGVDLATEEGRTVSAWIWRELGHAPPGLWHEQLPAVAGRACDLYRGFMEEFDACYLAPDPPGERWVRRDLRTRFGFAPEPAVEAVLERIRDRRFHLLVCCRNRYQPRLFGPETFDRRRLRGYFRRVAWVESRHVPLEEMRQVASAPADALDDWLLPLSDGEEGDDFRRRARLLQAFWEQPRFSRAMRLEGLVSLGMGFLTGEPDLAERCRRHLLDRLPAWEERWGRLTDRLRALLNRLGLAEAHLVATWHADDRAALERQLEALRGRLDRLRQLLQRHLGRLLPRPAEARQILEGFVHQQLGTVRFSRVGRELELLEERARRGAASLRRAGLCGPVADLLAAAERHLAGRPPSPRQRGLAPAERRRRRECLHAWLGEALGILGQARSLLARVHPPADRSGQAVAGWLSDLADLYELGVLDRVGVAGGLSRPAWRLERLLRTEG